MNGTYYALNGTEKDETMNETQGRTYDVSETTRLLGIPGSALRFYDRQGLVSPQRDSSGYRAYSAEDIVRLTDVVLLRDANVPVKTIRQLLSCPIDEAAEAIDEAETVAVKTLNQVSRAIAMLNFRSKAIRIYYAAKARGPHIVESPGIEAAYSFELDQAGSLQHYLGSPQTTRYEVFFSSANDSHNFNDCSQRPLPDSTAKLLWSRSSKQTRYVECLLETVYFKTEDNNLSETVEWMKRRGLKPGCAVAEYLTFDRPEGSDASADYYLCWIEIVED